MIRTRARYLPAWLIAIAASSAFVVMPGQSLAALAAEILALTAGCVAYTAWSALRAVRWEPSPFSAGLVGRWPGMGRVPGKTDLALHLGSYRMAGECQEQQTTKEGTHEQRSPCSART